MISYQKDHKTLLSIHKVVWFAFGSIVTLTCWQILTLFQERPPNFLVFSAFRQLQRDERQHDEAVIIHSYIATTMTLNRAPNVSTTIKTKTIITSENKTMNNVNLLASGSDSTMEQKRRKYQYFAPLASRPDAIINGNSKQYIEKESYCGSAPDYETFFAMDVRNRSLSDEDMLIYNMFFKEEYIARNSNKSFVDQNNNHKFHYVELGAFNGVKESNTRFFDVCLGWDGLLIEPNPRIYQSLVLNRPYAHRMSFAASCNNHEEVVENKTVKFWSSWYTNAVQDDSANRIEYAGKPNGDLVEVPCGSLTPVLLDLFTTNHQDQIGEKKLPPRIHFFSLDTEGMEPDVLRNVNFSEVFIDILISESVNSHCKTDDCKSRKYSRHIMVNVNGYLLYPNVIPRSDLYIHPQSPYLSKMTKSKKYQNRLITVVPHVVL